MEETCVHFDALDGAAGNTQLDHDPVVGFRVVPASLPAIVPGAGVHEDTGTVDGRSRGEQIRGCGEELVGAGKDFGIQTRRGQVRGVREDLIDLPSGDIGDLLGGRHGAGDEIAGSRFSHWYCWIEEDQLSARLKAAIHFFL